MFTIFSIGKNIPSYTLCLTQTCRKESFLVLVKVVNRKKELRNPVRRLPTHYKEDKKILPITFQLSQRRNSWTYPHLVDNLKKKEVYNAFIFLEVVSESNISNSSSLLNCLSLLPKYIADFVHNSDFGCRLIV